MPADADRRLDRTARKQHSVFTRQQALVAGVPASTLYKRVQRRVYEELQPATFRACSSPDTREAHLIAPILAAGGEAVLSHVSAASYAGLGGIAHPPLIDVLLLDRQVDGLRYTKNHRTLWLPEDHRTRHRGIPITSAARTICNCAGIVAPDVLRRMVADAVRRRSTTPAEIRACMDALAPLPGARLLRAILDEVTPQLARTRTEIEGLYLRITTRAGLPEATMNHPIRDHYGHRRLLDAAYIPERVASELDSEGTHTAAFDLVDDRRRQNAILLAGWRAYLRFTWWDLVNEPRRVVAEVATALSM